MIVILCMFMERESECTSESHSKSGLKSQVYYYSLHLPPILLFVEESTLLSFFVYLKWNLFTGYAFSFCNFFPSTSAVSISGDILPPGKASNTWFFWNVISL